jgi:hypothetical protein
MRIHRLTTRSVAHRGRVHGKYMVSTGERRHFKLCNTTTLSLPNIAPSPLCCDDTLEPYKTSTRLLPARPESVEPKMVKRHPGRGSHGSLNSRICTMPTMHVSGQSKTMVTVGQGAAWQRIEAVCRKCPRVLRSVEIKQSCEARFWLQLCQLTTVKGD